MQAQRVVPIALLLLVLGGAAGCGVSKMTLGPAGSARVWGTVLDRASGVPVAGASIWSPPSSVATTDQAGRYSLVIQWNHGDPTLDGGQECRASLSVTKAGYVSAHPEVICQDGTDYKEDIKLDLVR